MGVCIIVEGQREGWRRSVGKCSRPSGDEPPLPPKRRHDVMDALPEVGENDDPPWSCRGASAFCFGGLEVLSHDCLEHGHLGVLPPLLHEAPEALPKLRPRAQRVGQRETRSSAGREQSTAKARNYLRQRRKRKGKAVEKTARDYAPRNRSAPVAAGGAMCCRPKASPVAVTAGGDGERVRTSLKRMLAPRSFCS